MQKADYKACSSSTDWGHESHRKQVFFSWEWWFLAPLTYPPPNLLVVFVELWPLSNIQYPFLYKITKYHSQVELRHSVLHRYDAECDRNYWYSRSAPAHQDGKHRIRLTRIQMPLPPPAPRPPHLHPVPSPRQEVVSRNSRQDSDGKGVQLAHP